MVSSDDLLAAADWCKSYEDIGDGDAPDETAEAIHKVSEWLRRAAAKMELTQAARRVARETGAPVAVARRRLKEVMARS